MSLLNTGYRVNGVDLAIIFNPLTTTKTSNSGYKPNQTNHPGKADLSDMFEPYTPGDARASATYYLVANNDLNTKYKKRVLLNVTSSTNATTTYRSEATDGYTVICVFNTSTTISGSANFTFTNLKNNNSLRLGYIVVGGGGGGGFSSMNTRNGSGGGGGAGQIL
jgi:hypothetical protein